jgi:outer membrane protein
MIKKLTIAALFASNILYADIIGGEVSIGIYNHTPSGTASYTLPYTTLNSSVDLENDFGWSDNQDIMLKAYFENPIPFLPNAKIAYSNLSHDGIEKVNGFSWGEIINLNGEVDTSADFSMYDLTLYYELLDNVVEVDAGLTLRYLDGDISVDTIANFAPIPIPFISQSTTFSMWIPMVYGKARFNIPSTDISLQAEANFISYEETSFYDYEISARYTFTMGLGIEAGYKSIHLDSEDLTDGLVVDMDFSGPYASVVWDF